MTAANGELQNPFESTFDLLQSLRDEINDLRLCLVEEQHERARETSEIRQHLIEIRHAKNEKFEDIFNTVEELRKAKNSRFDKLEAYVEEFRAIKNKRFDVLDQKVETEINQREISCRSLDKTIQAEVAVLSNGVTKTDRELQEHQKKVDVCLDHHRNAHESLRLDVERLAAVLRDNSMSRDPHKHFRLRPGVNNQPQSPRSLEDGASSSPFVNSFRMATVGQSLGQSPTATKQNFSSLLETQSLGSAQVSPRSTDGNLASRSARTLNTAS